MGLNTCMLILNDALHDIEEDKDFGKKIAYAIQQSKRPLTIYSGRGNAASIISTYHADDLAIIAIGGNRGDIVGTVGDSSLDINKKEDLKRILRNIAKENDLEVSFKNNNKKSEK